MKAPDSTPRPFLTAPTTNTSLMRNFMSRVEYNDRGNVVTMEKLRSAES